MNILDLETKLAASGHYTGALDGIAGGKLRDGILAFLTDGPDLRLTEADLTKAAAQLSVPVAYVRALYEVESSGNAFVDDRPTILFEPHVFSRLTGHRFDNSHPKISSRVWNRNLYPRQQSDRYTQLIEAICLDPLAGFASASYGGFQILGSNAARCGATDAMAFAWAEAQSEGNQLAHFVAFIQSDAILWQALRRGDWVTVAKRYNGTGYFKNRYDVKLAQAVRHWGAA